MDEPVLAGGPTSTEFKSNESSDMTHCSETDKQSLNVKQCVDFFNKMANSDITNKLKSANEKIKNQDQQIINFKNGK